MDRNDIRAVIRAYDDIRKSLKEHGVNTIDTEDMVENIEAVINQYPEIYYRGPDVRSQP